ncbi:Alg9-like mannosyltransferase family-domain-containing protein [Hysterangium stoloniferum]|nr:Alg9-like mannosyltransferase family-domain-containing protein [Hysterangium stoloniferum]
MLSAATKLAIALRLAIALLTVTYFQPDEYFQALEPAHRVVFGYGHLTWEWQSRPPIRSIFFPMIYAPAYWLVKIWAPKIVQGLIASMTDIGVRRLARNAIGEKYVSTAFFLSVTSLFHLQALSRTLSNSVETSFTTFALSYWPFTSLHSSPDLIKPLLFAAIACMVRPTNAIIWSFMALELSWRLRGNRKALARVWLQIIIIGTIACCFLFSLDLWYFGTYTFTPFNFLITNLSPVSSFYGRNPWHYYLTQGIPIVSNLAMPFFLYGLWQALINGVSPLRRLSLLTLWTILVFSLTTHKEWRFIHPLLPVMHILAAKPLVDHNLTKGKKVSTASQRWRYVAGLFMLVSAPLLLQMQSHAQISVIDYLRSIPPDELRSVGFLMPCHSTPWQSHLHRRDLNEHFLWALGCEPPLSGQSPDTYQDQSDVFYASPLDYLKTRFPPAVDPQFPPSPFAVSTPGFQGLETHRWRHTWPSHLVFFDALSDHGGVMDFFEKLGYEEEFYLWNGWEQDERRRGGIRVWKWQG